MVQVLPYVPSFAENLSPALSNIIGGGVQHYAQKHKKARELKADEQILNKLDDKNLTEVQKISLLSKLSPERGEAFRSIYTPLLTQQAKNQGKLEQDRQKQEAINEKLKRLVPHLYEGQFQGNEQPQEVGDAQNIKPSTVSEPGTSIAPGEEQAAMPGMQGGQGDVGAPQRRQGPSDQELQLLAGDPDIGPVAKEMLTSRRNEAKLQGREREFGHNATAKYAEMLTGKSESGREIKHAISQGRAALRNKKPGEKALNVIYKTLHDRKNPLANLFQTENAQAQNLAQKTLAGGFRDLFGSKPTQAEFFWYENILPDLLKSDKVNEKIFDYFERVADIGIQEQEIADKIIRKNKGARPLDLDLQVRQGMKPYLDKLVKDGYELSGSQDGKVYVTNPDGKSGKIPRSQLEEALKAGYKEIK